MQVHIENDGPVTINLESPEEKQANEEVDKWRLNIQRSHLCTTGFLFSVIF